MACFGPKNYCSQVLASSSQGCLGSRKPASAWKPGTLSPGAANRVRDCKTAETLGASNQVTGTHFTKINYIENRSSDQL